MKQIQFTCEKVLQFLNVRTDSDDETYVRWCGLVEWYGLCPHKVWTWRQCSCLQCAHVIF